MTVGGLGAAETVGDPVSGGPVLRMTQSVPLTQPAAQPFAWRSGRMTKQLPASES